MDNTTGGKPPTLEALLQTARRRIEVDDAELKEARDRRDLIGAALRREFPGSRTYVNGSIAHGDALTPLTDVDLGVVVAGAELTHGPGKRGPQDLQEQAADAIRRDLKGEFPKLVVTVKGQKRAVLVRFGDPVTPGQPDFTSDVIVALDVPGERGLWIPCGDGWDRSDPEGHTRMVHAANKSSDAVYAQVVRLLKHWNRQNQKPLCSWNIKALALGCLKRRVTMLEGLRLWFDYAYKELSRNGETADPAGVAPEPIHLNESMTSVLGRLGEAADHLRDAVAFEKQGYYVLAHQELALMFNDEEVLPKPSPRSVELEAAARLAAERSSATGRRYGAVVPVAGSRPGPGRDTRSWAP